MSNRDDNLCGSEWAGCADDDDGVHRCDLVALHKGPCRCGNRYMDEYPKCGAFDPFSLISLHYHRGPSE